MPIVINHQPSASSLARIGYQAGAGEFQQQQRIMQQRERMQMRQIQAHQQMAMFEEFNRDRRAMLQAGAAEQMMKAKQEFEAEQARLDFEDQMIFKKMEEELAEDRAVAKFENAEQTDQRKAFRASTEQHLEAIADAKSRGYVYTEKEEEEVRKLESELLELKGKKLEAFPLGYAEGRDITVKKMPIPSMRTKSYEEDLRERMKTITLPNGEEQTFIQQPDGSDLHIPSKPDPKAAELANERRLENMTTMQKFKAAGAEDLGDLLLKLTKEMTVTIKEGGVAGGSETKPPSAGDVLKYLREFADGVDRLAEEEQERLNKKKQEGKNFVMEEVVQ